MDGNPKKTRSFADGKPSTGPPLDLIEPSNLGTYSELGALSLAVLHFSRATQCTVISVEHDSICQVRCAARYNKIIRAEEWWENPACIASQNAAYDICGASNFLSKKRSGVFKLPEQSLARFDSVESGARQARYSYPTWCVPCVLHEKIIGLLFLHYEDAEVAHKRNRSIISRIAPFIAVALKHSGIADKNRKAGSVRRKEYITLEHGASPAKVNRILFDVNERMAGEPNDDALLPIILAEAGRALGAHSGIVFDYRNDIEALQIRCGMLNGAVGPTLAGFPFGDAAHPCPVKEFPELQYLIDSDAPAFALISLETAETETAGKLKTWHESVGNKLAMVSALKLGGKLLGTLSLGFKQKKRFTESDNEACIALVEQATLAMHFSRLAKAARQIDVAREQGMEAKRRALAVARANKVTSESLVRLANSLSPDDCLGNVLAVCVKEFGAVGGSAWLFNSASGKYRMLANMEGDSIQRYSEAMHPGLMGADPMIPVRKVGRKKRIFVYREQDFAKEISFRPYREYLLERKVKTVMALPLVFGERPTGFLNLRFMTDRTLTDEEEQLLHTLGNQAVLAIEMAQLSKHAQAAAVLEERHRLARDIHDGMIQAFIGIAMQLESVKTDGEVAEKIRRAIATARQGLSEARRSVEALRPRGIGNQSFPTAIQHLLQVQFGQSHLSLKFEASGTWLPLHPNTEEHLFRITQEAINNVLKHSNAKSASIELSSAPNEASLLISDDGDGFSMNGNGALQTGFGLDSMKQRAALAGAKLTIVSGPKAGTQVFVSVERTSTSIPGESHGR